MNSGTSDVEWALTARDEEVGPACMNVIVPPTTATDPGFREIYEQGYRHALSDVRKVLDGKVASS